MADNLEKVKPLSQTNIDEVRLLLEDTPEQSIRQVARQLPLNRSSVHQVLGKKPKMYPHRLKIVHALKKCSPAPSFYRIHWRWFPIKFCSISSPGYSRWLISWNNIATLTFSRLSAIFCFHYTRSIRSRTAQTPTSANDVITQQRNLAHIWSWCETKL